MEPRVLGALALSVVSSVSIVLCNKYLMSVLNFNFATTLTAWHLGVTFLALHVARTLGWFEHKGIDWGPQLLFGIINGCSIGFLNLSLGFNSVGFYQMTKLAIIPCTVMIQILFYNKTFSRSVQLSLAVLLLGVGVATVTDLEANFVGTMLSAAAIITTCYGQITTNTIQKNCQVSSTQLLYQSSPIQSATLMLCGPLFDKYLTGQNVFRYDYNQPVLFFIILSCLVSISVNFSTFLVIGITSPVTYQVLGHLKTCLVLSAGFMLFASPWNYRNLSGIAIAVVGMVAYTHYNSKPTATHTPQPNRSGDPEAGRPLLSRKQSDADMASKE
eukprot:jgi/Chlat1/3679/Chrsp24S03851